MLLCQLDFLSLQKNSRDLSRREAEGDHAKSEGTSDSTVSLLVAALALQWSQQEGENELNRYFIREV